MNSIIWGTCNTTLGLSQCEANMNWFVGSLQTSCSQELKDNNALTVATLIGQFCYSHRCQYIASSLTVILGLQAFSVMYDVACQSDPTSNTYCYLNAVKSSNPADSYYYALPLGIPVPQTATPTCSTCSKSIMGIYAGALQNSSESSKLAGLQQTYDATAELTVQSCGANFVATNIGSSAMPSLRPSWTITGALVIFALFMTSAS